MTRTAALLLALLALAGCTSARPAPRPQPSPTVSAVAQVNALLAERAAAVLHRDRAAFAATISPAATAEQRQAQLDQFAAASALTFRVYAQVLAGGAQPPTTGRWSATADLSYQLGREPTAVQAVRAFTFDDGPAGWGVTTETNHDAPWDFGPLTEVTGTASLVVAPASQRAAAQHLSALADAAVPAVTKVWGTAWDRWLLVVLPASEKELQALVGVTQDLSSLAAVQSVELSGNSAAGDRILINPDVFLQHTSATGQQVIMTHEATHVASASVTPSGMPLWLVEGLADFVGFGTTSLTPAEGAPELAAQVKAQGVPAALPADDAFTPTDPHVVEAYEEAWLACRLMARTVGAQGLVAFYRAVGGGATVDAALGSVLHTTLAHFTAAWQAALRSELA